MVTLEVIRQLYIICIVCVLCTFCVVFPVLFYNVMVTLAVIRVNFVGLKASEVLQQAFDEGHLMPLAISSVRQVYLQHQCILALALSHEIPCI